MPFGLNITGIQPQTANGRGFTAASKSEGCAVFLIVPTKTWIGHYGKPG